MILYECVSCFTFISFSTHPLTCRDFSLLCKQISRSTCRLIFYYDVIMYLYLESWILYYCFVSCNAFWLLMYRLLSLLIFIYIYFITYYKWYLKILSHVKFRCYEIRFKKIYILIIHLQIIIYKLQLTWHWVSIQFKKFKKAERQNEATDFATSIKQALP